MLAVQTDDPAAALRILFFFQQDKSPFGYFYSSMTDFVVFGLGFWKIAVFPLPGTVPGSQLDPVAHAADVFPSQMNWAT